MIEKVKHICYNEIVPKIGSLAKEYVVTVNYNKLWKLLIDRGMSRTQLREQAGITTNAMAKMGKNCNVSTEVLCKICKTLDCQITDILELVKEDEGIYYVS